MSSTTPASSSLAAHHHHMEHEWELIDGVDSHRTVQMDLTSPSPLQTPIHRAWPSPSPTPTSSTTSSAILSDGSMISLPSSVILDNVNNVNVNNNVTNNTNTSAPMDASLSLSIEKVSINELEVALAVARKAAQEYADRAHAAEAQVHELANQLADVSNARDNAVAMAAAAATSMDNDMEVAQSEATTTMVALNDRIRQLEDREAEHLRQIQMLNALIMR
jgi:hypothetical protein